MPRKPRKASFNGRRGTSKPSTEFMGQLSEIMYLSGLTLTEIADRTGYAYSSIQRMRKGSESCAFFMVEHVCTTLGYKLVLVPITQEVTNEH